MRLLLLLNGEELPPTRLLPSPEGGVALSFVDDGKRAEIEMYNSGEVIAATYSQTDEPSVWEIETDDHSVKSAIERIRLRRAA